MFPAGRKMYHPVIHQPIKYQMGGGQCKGIVYGCNVVSFLYERTPQNSSNNSCNCAIKVSTHLTASYSKLAHIYCPILVFEFLCHNFVGTHS